MAFFVPPELLPHQKGNENEPVDRLDLLLLSNAKKMHLTFDEVGLFRVRDFIEFTHIYFPELQDGAKEATQDDIDKLLA